LLLSKIVQEVNSVTTLDEAYALEDGLKALGIELPAVPTAVRSYKSARRAGQLLFLSRQGRRDHTGTLNIGKVGLDCTVEEAKEDARRIGLQLLSTIRQTIGSLDPVESVEKLLGMVKAVPEFTERPKIIDGCSSLSLEVLGDRGHHARSAIGVGSLPFGMTVEIKAIVLIADGN
jgi:enamine deaminase RidA (YjgF/YER057c/UK114 family)